MYTNTDGWPHLELLPLLKGEIFILHNIGPGAVILLVCEDGGVAVIVEFKADIKLQGNVFLPEADVDVEPGGGQEWCRGSV